MLTDAALAVAVLATLFSLVMAVVIRARFRRWLAAAYLRGYREGRREHVDPGR